MQHRCFGETRKGQTHEEQGRYRAGQRAGGHRLMSEHAPQNHQRGGEEHETVAAVAQHSQPGVVRDVSRDAEEQKSAVNDDDGDQPSLAHERRVHCDQDGQKEHREDRERRPTFVAGEGHEHPNQHGEQYQDEPVAVRPPRDTPHREPALGRERARRGRPRGPDGSVVAAGCARPRSAWSRSRCALRAPRARVRAPRDRRDGRRRADRSPRNSLLAGGTEIRVPRTSGVSPPGSGCWRRVACLAWTDRRQTPSSCSPIGWNGRAATPRPVGSWPI